MSDHELGGRSESGQAQPVIHIRSGHAHRRPTPDNSEGLLVGAIFMAKQARKYHGAFGDAMRAEVLETDLLLAETTDIGESRKWVLGHRIASTHVVVDMRQELRRWMEEVPVQDVPEWLKGGLKMSDMKTDFGTDRQVGIGDMALGDGSHAGLASRLRAAQGGRRRPLLRWWRHDRYRAAGRSGENACHARRHRFFDTIDRSRQMTRLQDKIALITGAAVRLGVPHDVLAIAVDAPLYYDRARYVPNGLDRCDLVVVFKNAGIGGNVAAKTDQDIEEFKRPSSPAGLIRSLAVLRRAET